MYRDNHSQLAVSSFPRYNKSLFYELPTCKTAEDYDSLVDPLYDLKFERNYHVIPRKAKKQCPDLCTRLWYQVKVESIQDSGDEYNSEAADVYQLQEWKWQWKIVLATSTVTKVTQFFSYNINELISDLGGSWGLFLGFSLMTVFEILDTALKKIVPATQVLERT